MGEVIATNFSEWHGSLQEAIKEISDKMDGLSWSEKRVIRGIYNYLATRFHRNPTNYARILERDMNYIPTEQIVYWLKISLEDVINVHAWSLYCSEITTKNEVMA